MFSEAVYGVAHGIDWRKIARFDLRVAYPLLLIVSMASLPLSDPANAISRSIHWCSTNIAFDDGQVVDVDLVLGDEGYLHCGRSVVGKKGAPVGIHTEQLLHVFRMCPQLLNCQTKQQKENSSQWKSTFLTETLLLFPVTPPLKSLPLQNCF